MAVNNKSRGQSAADLPRLVFIDFCQERELLVINASLLVKGAITCEFSKRKHK